MAAEAKDQTGASQDASGVASSHSTAAQANRNGYAPKVRKPYTITKQRERWTEEEHQRFVEALKLYGRAWRQIEEHLGSKTAIQIRSHAQKFFAKVTRDSSVDAEGSSGPIAVPPPRPKKKPLHPYPRKTFDRANTEVMASHQREGTNDDVSFAKRENYSPTSVFSAIGSDILESSVADLHQSRLSPASCATDAFSDNEASNSSSKDECGLCLPLKLSSASVLDNKSTVETESTLDSLYTIEPYMSIKLFGQTVVVRDTPKQSLEVAENSELSQLNEEAESHSDNVVKGFASNNLDSEVAFGFVSGTPRGAEDQMVGSLVGSNSGSMCGLNGDSRNCDAFESSSPPGEESAKRFVPYKQCLVERDDQPSISLLQGREGQRAHLGCFVELLESEHGDDDAEQNRT